MEKRDDVLDALCMSDIAFDVLEAVRVGVGEPTSRRPGGLYMEGCLLEFALVGCGLMASVVFVEMCTRGVVEEEFGSSSASNEEFPCESSGSSA